MKTAFRSISPSIINKAFLKPLSIPVAFLCGRLVVWFRVQGLNSSCNITTTAAVCVEMHSRIQQNGVKDWHTTTLEQFQKQLQVPRSGPVVSLLRSGRKHKLVRMVRSQPKNTKWQVYNDLEAAGQVTVSTVSWEASRHEGSSWSRHNILKLDWSLLLITWTQWAATCSEDRRWGLLPREHQTCCQAWCWWYDAVGTISKFFRKAWNHQQTLGFSWVF